MSRVSLFWVVLVALLAAAGGRLAQHLGAFVVTSSHHNEPTRCHLVKQGITDKGKLVDLMGPEDVAVSSNGFAFISTDDRHWLGQLSDLAKVLAAPPGAIYIWDLETSDAVPRMLSLRFGTGRKVSEFHPHGIGLSEISKDQWELYVVAHATTGEHVYVFAVMFDDDAKEGGEQGRKMPTGLRLLQDIQSPAFTLINDIAPINPSKLKSLDGTTPDAAELSRARGFFVTNFAHHPHGSLMMNLEMMGILARANVVLCTLDFSRGSQWKCLPFIEGLKCPNGIRMSPDQDRLYVATSISHRLEVYDLHLRMTPGSIGSRKVEAPLIIAGNPFNVTALDNIDVDQATGDLYIGSHPSLLKYTAHSQDFDNVDGPSQVFRVRLPKGSVGKIKREEVQVTEVFADDGKMLSASAVGAYHKVDDGQHELLIGGVFRPGVLRCRFKDGEVGFGGSV